MSFLRHTILTLSASVLLLANPYQNQNEEIASVIASGDKASELMLSTLGGALKKHLKAGGPMDAVQFCTKEAFPLTDKVNKELGKDVSIKRISLKYRNPANAPQKDEQSILEAMETLNSAGVILPEHMVEQVDKDTYKYYKPLRINAEVCLKCHGNIKGSEMGAFVAKHYPQDKAVGYKMGDLRGAIVVTVKK